MTSVKRIHYIRELQDIQQAAVEAGGPVSLHSPDGIIQVDAKSYIGMYALDFSQPVLIVSDDDAFHQKIRGIGENVKLGGAATDE